MRYLFWPAVLGLIPFAVPVNANQGWYLSIEAGTSSPSAGRADVLTSVSFPLPPAVGPATLGFTSLSSDSGLIGLGAIGTHLSQNFRLELEFSHQTGKFARITVDQNALMLNAAFDVNLIDKLDLSLGAGAGFGLATFDAVSQNNHSTAPAFQLTAGLAYPISDSTQIVLNYRYFDAPNIKLGAISSLGSVIIEDVKDTAVTVGLRFGL